MAGTDVVGHVQQLDSGKKAARRTVAVHWFIYVGMWPIRTH